MAPQTDKEKLSLVQWENDLLKGENERLRSRIDNLIQARTYLEADNMSMREALKHYRSMLEDLLLD